ncbi:hypothetical protein Dimus_029740 [Dionaea muscipula]
MGSPSLLRALVGAGATIVGGMFALSLATSATMSIIRPVFEAKRKKMAKSCEACRGKGFYICKLCKGSNKIEWSPLYDPIAINPCLCPTCDGHG